MVLNKTKLLWLFSSVMSIYYLCVIPDVASFHLGKPVSYISFIEDEIDSGMENSSFEVNSLNTIPDMKTKLQNEITTSKVGLSGSSPDLEGSSDEQPKLELFGSSFLEKNGTHVPTGDDDNLSELPNYVSDDLSESPDCMSTQFTRFYLEAITNLIRRTMDVFFSSNVPAENTTLSEICNSDCDTNIHRHIKKRDLSLNENVLHNANWSTVDTLSAGNGTTTHINLESNFNSSTQVTNRHRNILNETRSSVQQKQTENNISYETKLPYSLENSFENTQILNVTEANENNKRENTPHTIYNETELTTDDSRVTFVSYKPSSLGEFLKLMFGDFVNNTDFLEENILEETKPKEKDNIVIDDPKNNNISMLTSAIITNQINGVRKERGSAEYDDRRILSSRGYHTRYDAGSTINRPMLALMGSVFLLVFVLP